MGAESALEAEFAHRVNIKAATQDYILEPRIGNPTCSSEQHLHSKTASPAHGSL